MTDPALVQPDDDDDDRTTVVERSAPVADDENNETLVVDRVRHRADDPHDGTVVVDRAGAPAGHDDDDDDDNGDGDGTIVAGRRRAHQEQSDGTIVVPRAPTEKSRSASRPLPDSRRGRRRITLPPVEPGFGPEPVDAVGAGAVDSYTPRPIAAPPAAAPAIPLGADATRAPAPSMPSVSRRSGRLGAIALGGFVLACVVSVVGLAIIVTTLLG